MALSIQKIAKRLSTHSRRALIAMFLTGSLISSVAFAENDRLPLADDNSVHLTQVESDASDNALDYWIFSDDYCGWASAETFANPFSSDPFATEPARVSATSSFSKPVTALDNLVDQALAASKRQESIENDLVELAKSEPVDVAAGESAIDSSQHATQFCGSSPVIVTIAEGYLPYDLDHEDLISLQRYPITIPKYDYVGVDRTVTNGLAGRGPLDCLGHGVIWNESVMPAVTVETNLQPDYISGAIELWNEVHLFVITTLENATTRANESQAKVITTIIEEAQPDSQFLQTLSPIRIGQQFGTAVNSVSDAVAGPVSDATQSIVSWNFENEESQRELGQSAGEQLLVRAGIEADALDCATAGVADVAVTEHCPVERFELAAIPPATYELAAVGVAAATLSMPQVPQELRDGISRAEAIATACQSTAATLERLATALRKAGDSVVRVARASAEGGTGLR